MRMLALFCLSAAVGFAGTWTGYLVNGNCYASMERNKNPSDTESYVDRDRGFEIRYCSPNAKTKAFTLVLDDGETLKLDTAGNAKAEELVKNTGKKRYFRVEVTGVQTKDTVKVDTISAIK